MPCSSARGAEPFAGTGARRPRNAGALRQRQSRRALARAAKMDFRCQRFIHLASKNELIGLEGGKRRWRRGAEASSPFSLLGIVLPFFFSRHFQRSFLTAGCGKNRVIGLSQGTFVVFWRLLPCFLPRFLLHKMQHRKAHPTFNLHNPASKHFCVSDPWFRVRPDEVHLWHA